MPSVIAQLTLVWQASPLMAVWQLASSLSALGTLGTGSPGWLGFGAPAPAPATERKVESGAPELIYFPLAGKGELAAKLLLKLAEKREFRRSREKLNQ